ncbi:GroES-like protein [Rhodofomes roseus]|uniref:GroES-like protein n=1 Tax=Rhodofomes roseus TaxID=34475 RepID=A0ABQ8KLB7_9APHY|nr:GroES-like protein [Rhodofomes roseus]KAH9838996.1 GroES-like protein [Rhodofomes roseus]
MRAVIVQPEKRVAVKDHPVPELGPEDVLVKVVAAAQNPTDWKFVDFVQKAGTILGVDFSGVVIAAGSNVADLTIGTRVAGFVLGGALPDSAFWTAVQALYHPTRLALAEIPSKLQDGSDEWVFLYGESTSVGLYAIQLLRLSGYKSATVCSADQFDLVKSLGADVVINRHAPDSLQQIREATGGKRGFDSASLQFTVATMGPAGGRVISLIGQDQEGLKKAVKEGVEVKSTLIYTALGHPFGRYDASVSDRTHMTAFLRKLPDLVSSGSTKPSRVNVWEGPGGEKGLEGVESALQWMRDGKVRGEKIVHIISNA